MFNKIKELCEHEIMIMEPEEIDNNLNDPDMNLNRLEGVVSAKLIEKINADKVILDCPSNNIPAYREYVKSFVKKDVEIIAEHKADLNHTIVGAASILAKVTRDRIIEEYKKKIIKPGIKAIPDKASTMNKYEVAFTTSSIHPLAIQIDTATQSIAKNIEIINLALRNNFSLTLKGSLLCLSKQGESFTSNTFSILYNFCV